MEFYYTKFTLYCLVVIALLAGFLIVFWILLAIAVGDGAVYFYYEFLDNGS